ncbi:MULTISPECIES: Twin-arginine translocation pathway signal [Roseobacteraceae]|uniref:Twin-arginine translocation pathway signal n=1 Tax=Roseobacteraceae TaxID=2854170 RepID=UPI0013B8B5DC|nr:MULTISPECIES: Twin-arginine translocation pathway signal [Roseobacteraceae]MCA0997439.1 Twin-arginine translocation pathway signal [Alloyangia pacifica]NDV99102.1 Twin-arginine translocation pathway signal [Salipiger sp. PrR002]NDW56055.1 Twin-arginine translocation pathway signal [Salipiger sp. PrR004]
MTITASHRSPNRGLTRRQLLSRASAAGASFVVGAGFVAAPDAAWAAETTSLDARVFATLVQMARDIYPHDKIPDENYVIAVKGYDSPEAAEGITAGIAALDAAAQGKGFDSYLDTGWERDRVDILRGMEESAFFQQVRGGLVTGLYNQKAVWPIFGYEGESYSQGGYINRGFDDIAWL